MSKPTKAQVEAFTKYAKGKAAIASQSDLNNLAREGTIAKPCKKLLVKHLMRGLK